MTDPRETPRNDRVAAKGLSPDLIGDRVAVAGEERQVTCSVVDLLRAPGGPRDRQLVFGESVTTFEERDGWSFVQAQKDGYVGYVASDALGARTHATHKVSRAATHVYAAPTFKSRDLRSLSFGSRVHVLSIGEEMAETPGGFIPNTHLCPVEATSADPMEIAALFMGVPYLWGGNSWWGIDCSGLVQAACLSCGIPCPGDSDQQARQLGQPISDGSVPMRGDLLFWKGHVAWVHDTGVLLHASSHNMETKLEPLDVVRDRIAGQGDGPIIAHRRVSS